MVHGHGILLCRRAPFRQAITDANLAAGLDTINFAIGSELQTITLLAGLPTISFPVFIDGRTQRDSSRTTTSRR